MAISLLLLVLFISSPSVLGKSAPAADCSTVLVNMAGCMSFVIIGSTVDKPEGSCCSGLKKVLDTNWECLCEGLKNSGSMGIKVNVTKASTLPVACKLNAPPVTSCGLSTPPPPPPPPVKAPPALAPAPATGSRSGPSSAPAPSPSQGNRGSSLIPISGLSLVISGALLMLFSRI